MQNIPRHVEVPFQKCEDPDTIAKPGRVKYPNGLVCAGDTGTKITMVLLLKECMRKIRNILQ